MRLSEHAKATVRDATARVNLWSGPVGSSKTQTSTLALIRHLATEAPPGPVAIVGYSQDTVQQNVVPALQSWLGVDNIGVRKNRLQMLGRNCYVFGGGNEASQAAIAGMSAATAYVDEASLVAESMWNMLITRLRIPGKPRLYGTTNPANPRHWLYRGWITADKLAHFVMTPADNLGLDPDQWAFMQSSYTGAFYKRMILGQWVAAEGAIYPHTLDRVWRSEVPRMQAYHLGLDYGTSNPFAVLLIGEGIDRRAYVLDELYHDGREQGQRSDEEYVGMVRAWLLRNHDRWPGSPRPQRFVSDPSAASMLVALRRHGFAASSGDNSVHDGIRWVGSLMATDHLRFLPHCTHTIDEHAGYVWDDKAAEKGRDEPLKVDDHTPDGLRYLATDRQRAWRGWMGLHLKAVA